MFPKLEQVAPATFEAPDPDDAGPATSAGLLRTALRIGFRASAGPFRSLARLAVEPRAYQLVPLLMALRQDTVRMLISDDVGIGKTVEAGLIAAELLEQGDAPELAVLCGPALAEQWQRELRTKFGIHAELVLPSTIRRLENGPAARRDAVRPVPEHRGLDRLHQAPRAAGAVLARLPGPADHRRGAHLRVRRHRRQVADAAPRARHGPRARTRTGTWSWSRRPRTAARRTASATSSPCSSRACRT